MEVVQVRIRIDELARRLAGKRIKPKQLAEMLAISEKSAGKILAKMERLGYARRRTKKYYEILAP